MAEDLERVGSIDASCLFQLLGDVLQTGQEDDHACAKTGPYGDGGQTVNGMRRYKRYGRAWPDEADARVEETEVIVEDDAPDPDCRHHGNDGGEIVQGAEKPFALDGSLVQDERHAERKNQPDGRVDRGPQQGPPQRVGGVFVGEGAFVVTQADELCIGRVKAIVVGQGRGKTDEERSDRQ